MLSLVVLAKEVNQGKKYFFYYLRYCYGGMRNKFEVQPPVLPDLSGEVMGIVPPAVSVSQPFSGSGAPSNSSTSSNASGSVDFNKGTSVATTDPIVGVSGQILVDVSSIILQYVQQVLGTSFSSLYQLAQHLITNRFVNPRSKNAFALVAYAANNANACSSSPTPTSLASFNENLQKGVNTQTKFRKSGSNSENKKSFVKIECPFTPFAGSPVSSAPVPKPNLHSTPTTDTSSSFSYGNMSTLNGKSFRETPVKSSNVSSFNQKLNNSQTSPYSQPLLSSKSFYGSLYENSNANSFDSSTNATAVAIAAAAMAAQHHMQHKSDATSNTSGSPALSHINSGKKGPTDLATSTFSPSFSNVASSVVPPPRPLQPIVGGKSPYAPTYGVNQFNKRSQPPLDAPGSYDPCPAVHLGSLSPTKRSRYSESDQSASSKDSSKLRSAQQNFYPGRFDGLGMLSPAPMNNELPCSDIVSSESNRNRSNEYQMNSSKSKNYPTNQPAISTTSAPITSNPVKQPFIPPPAFTLSLDDDSCYDSDLPRLGASPMPQIPPSSPSDFLPFYSSNVENASSSANIKLEQQDHNSEMNRTLTNDQSFERGNRHRSLINNSNSSEEDLAPQISCNGEVNTPPPPKELLILEPTSPTAPQSIDDQVLKRQELQNQLHTPGAESNESGLSSGHGSIQCSSEIGAVTSCQLTASSPASRSSGMPSVGQSSPLVAPSIGSIRPSESVSAE